MADCLEMSSIRGRVSFRVGGAIASAAESCKSVGQTATVPKCMFRKVSLLADTGRSASQRDPRDVVGATRRGPLDSRSAFCARAHGVTEPLHQRAEVGERREDAVDGPGTVPRLGLDQARHRQRPVP
jgi:hypothetical protein